MRVDTDLVRGQILEITKHPFDFWLLNLEDDYRNLSLFFEKTDVPSGAEIFTSEGVFPGKETEPILKEAVWNCATEADMCMAEREILIEFAKELQNLTSGVISCERIKEIINEAKTRKVRLWLGGPYYEDHPKTPKLYNSYLLIENGGIRFIHRKKFLWPTEEGIFETLGREGINAISIPDYDGIFENRAILICQEAPRFYAPKWGRSPTHIPEIREAKPDFVIIPAHWIGEEGDSPEVRLEKERMLRQIGLAISRKIKEPIDRFSAVRERGCFTLVVNAFDVYICGPSEGKRIKAQVYAQQPRRGWLRINNQGITSGEF